jgi:hypothetical protein
MMAIRPETMTLDFTGMVEDCWMCKATGKQYRHAEDCKDCNGKGKIKTYGRNKKCKTCDGRRIVYLETPKLVGDCHYCKGTGRRSFDLYREALKADLEWIFDNLFNFKDPYEGRTSEFNEQYLGLGLIAGIVDYGRYLSMTEDEFKNEVKYHFLTRHNQYISLTKNGKLPKEVRIKRGRSGWSAYPVWE